MESYIDFVTRLIYATGSEAIITPNHDDWLAANPSPSGTAWLDHHVDAMLATYETWLSDNELPPIVAWDGRRPIPWDAAHEFPLGSDLDGSFTGVATLDDLGSALQSRYSALLADADEFDDSQKDPFSYRYWGYMKWASLLRRRFLGEIVIPPAIVYDRDGTILSAVPFCDVFNELHWRWHNSGGASFPTPLPSAPTPGFRSSVGQRARAGGVGMGGGEEFLIFHREHFEVFSRWLARSGQPPVRGINMNNGGTGWPGSNTGNPSIWTENDDDPWINDEAGDTDTNLLTGTTDANDLGNDVNFGVHGAGHFLNTDIAPIRHNNYVPRFQAWHGWIDNQLWWREPRFARWDAETGLRERVFEPVLSTGDDWPGLPAITIIRDPAAAGDTIAPVDAVSGLDMTSGAGTLRMRFLVKDSYDRAVTLRLTAEVFNDAVDPTTSVETLPAATNTYIVGDTGSGDDFDLETEFTVDFTFANAFESDDPAAASAAVGFVNSRIRISGELEAAGEPAFVHRDYYDVNLVQEKEAPEIELFFDLSTFSEDQVASALDAGESRFSGALIVVVQDRTSRPAEPPWPAETADEIKGLVTGFVPASGLFADIAHAPGAQILEEAADTPVAGLSLELSSGPLL